jgi:1,2-diacylglycerol 3-beta-galactosyltransferase
MARLMTAADIIVTKAGPSTIAEACVAGLPMIISGKVPGQEDGNVDHIVDNGAGVYAPSPELVGEALAAWVNSARSTLDDYAAAAIKLARPRAAWDVAQEIHTITQNPPLHATQPIRPSWSLFFPRFRPDVTNPPQKSL